MEWYTLEQHVFLYDMYVKYRSARKSSWKFQHKFSDERVPSGQKTHNLVNKRRTTGLLIDEKHKYKPRVPIVEMTQEPDLKNTHLENHWNV
jgi:hypothetical protein